MHMYICIYGDTNAPILSNSLHFSYTTYANKTHAHTHTRTHARTHARTHTHTHTHTLHPRMLQTTIPLMSQPVPKLIAFRSNLDNVNTDGEFEHVVEFDSVIADDIL